MKLAPNGPSQQSIRAKIQEKFAEFNQTIPSSQGRRYPADLRELIRRGYSAGVSITDLSRLSGMSRSAVDFVVKDRSKPNRPAARRLQVVDREFIEVETEPERATTPSPMVIKLPSGLSLELSDSRALTVDLLHMLMRVGGVHAASR